MMARLLRLAALGALGYWHHAATAAPRRPRVLVLTLTSLIMIPPLPGTTSRRATTAGERKWNCLESDSEHRIRAVRVGDRK
jgi:hypothetical protein